MPPREGAVTAAVATMVNGARNALLGYLYQFVGTAAVRVLGVEPGDDAWARLVITPGGQLHSEEFGQDAVLRPLGDATRGATAIQFKHSAVTARAIEHPELLDILAAFHDARETARAAGETIDSFFLVTNRRLADATQEVLTHAGRTATPHRSLRLPAPGSAKSTAASESRLAPHRGNPDTAAGVWHAILQNLEVRAGESHESGLARLRAFAARYGVLDREWDGRLNALVGAFVTGTADGTPIPVTPEWLKEHLVGDPAAANLDFESRVPPHIAEAGRRRLEAERGRHWVPAECYLERRVHADLRAALELYPIVFVAGAGGCGKSLAVERYLESVADRQLVWREPASRASEAVVVAGILAARMPGRRSGGLDRTLHDTRARLDRANPAGRPVWTIDLDGVDEMTRPNPELRQLIHLCWANGDRDESPASLVVTCRASTGEGALADLVMEWLDFADPELARNVGFVAVGPFDKEELLDAARLIGEPPERRIVETLSLPELGAALGRVGHSAPVPEDILRTLRHPVVWGSYASLSGTERAGVLDRNPAQLDRLARRLLDRFLGRCRRRKDWTDQLMLQRALDQLARDVAGPPPHRIDSWLQACAPCLGPVEARRFYNECLSYGLIERDVGSGWRWSHPFLVAHLAARPGGDADE